MASLNNAVLEAVGFRGQTQQGNLVDEVPASIAWDDDDEIVAGYGRCHACQREGRKPGCGGYVSGPNSMCRTCGHNFTQHA